MFLCEFSLLQADAFLSPAPLLPLNEDPALSQDALLHPWKSCCHSSLKLHLLGGAAFGGAGGANADHAALYKGKAGTLASPEARIPQPELHKVPVMSSSYGPSGQT